MINIRRWINETYLYNRLENKDIFYITLIALVVVFLNFTTIIWWVMFVIVVWVLHKIYNIKKKHIDEEELDKYCKPGSIDPRCIMYKNAKSSYTKIVNNINSTL